MTDFGLDIRATVTLAAGALLFPTLYLLYTQSVEQLATASAPASSPIRTLLCYRNSVRLSRHNDDHPGSRPVATRDGRGFGLHRFRLDPRQRESGVARANGRKGRRRGRSRRSAFVSGTVLLAAALSVAAYIAAEGLSDSGNGHPPVILQFVLPVNRGVLTVGTKSVCVDKVGAASNGGCPLDRHRSGVGWLRGRRLRTRGRLGPLRPARPGTLPDQPDPAPSDPAPPPVAPLRTQGMLTPAASPARPGPPPGPAASAGITTAHSRAVVHALALLPHCSLGGAVVGPSRPKSDKSRDSLHDGR